MREKWQAKLAMWRERQDDKTNHLHGRAKYFYYVMALITLLCFSVLLVKIVTYEAGASEDSGTGKKSELSLGESSIQMISRKYNPNNHYLEILVQVQQEVVDLNKHTEVLVTEGEKKQRLAKKWIQVTDQYYVLSIPNVPQDWSVMFIDVGVIVMPENQAVEVDLDNLLGDTSGEKQKNDTTIYQDLWTITREKTTTQQNLEPQSEPSYVIKYSELEIKESNKKLKEINQYIKELEKEIKKVEEKIKTLEGEKRYQISSEMEKTDQAILRFEGQIDAAQNKIISETEAGKELQEKINKLKLRQEDQRKLLKEEKK
ncbi:hypothetical protein ABFW39_002853 [Listeria monocytogenes]|nr:hypothetical protein [Listeria monocytogenes]EHM3340508.1 hypothetical protein [Listeria monocytogenes]EHM3395548.1 hypothetical protein [Listeria monocytogenes]EJW2904564.1 hypothetical protein [Listeria monocytogenes]